MRDLSDIFPEIGVQCSHHMQCRRPITVFEVIIFIHHTIVYREAARECRRKKKEYIKCLENRVAVLENQVRVCAMGLCA